MPSRTVGNQRIPTTCAPGFGDPFAFQNKVQNPVLAQMFTHRHSSLACTNNKCIDCFFNFHVRTLLPGGLIQFGHPITILIL
ncbi:MAG: hypothetical protein VYD06_02885 [SAR324 cluster bacterium]|nr:hypothetical protein [SAR324 cluster bacterium]